MVKAKAVRRSIVEFEKWLDGQIENVKTELLGLRMEAQSVGEKQAEQEVKLKTLQAVALRLASQPEAAEEELVAPEPEVLTR